MRPELTGVDLARVLAADLRDLAVDLSAGSYTRTTLAMLQRNLQRLVPSALGAAITLQPEEGCAVPVRVNLVARLVEPYEIGAALRVPLDRLMPTTGGSVVFYASRPGAFARVATELGLALGLDPGELDENAPRPTRALTPSVDGLQDFSLVNRALGVLLHRGYTLTQARSELDRRAGDARVDVAAAARAVLTSVYL